MSSAIPGVREMLFPRAVVNAYLVEADVLTLVDTGTPGGAGKVLAAVRSAGHDPRDVGRILLTHRHSDHAGNAAELARETGAAVHASRTTRSS
jgi:glyoxylase-like metal-dependent hydrolase (beta-lactamase superfamily II)